MYCSNCGNAVSEGVNFCGGCGAPVTRSVPASGQQPAYADSEAELRQFVGKKSDYYINKWKKAKNNRSWNWAAFFLGLFWVGYRKMYKVIFIIFGIFIVTDVITLFLNQAIADKLNYGISTGLSVVLGISGNYFYSIYSKRKIQKIKDTFPHNPEIQAKEIQRQGGGSWKGVFISLGLLVAYIAINLGLFSLYDNYVQNTENKSVKSEVAQSSDQSDEYINQTDDPSEEATQDDSSNNSVEEETTVSPVDSSTEPSINSSASDDTAVLEEEPIAEENPEVTYEDIYQSYMQDNGITLTARDVQYDMLNNLDQDFAIMGTAELDTYYNWGFADAESEYFSVDITPFDGEYGDNWNLYFNRNDFAELFNLLKTSGNVTIAATGIIPSNMYEDGQGNLALAKQATWGD
jgi:hypothetical protein